MNTQTDITQTPKGTKLPLLNLKGKHYLQVAHRLVWFREEHPDWIIETDIIEKTDKHVIMRAKVYDSTMKLVASAHKREDHSHFADFLEKAETSAIGRALALCGYGTQFCGSEFDEGERLADSPQPNANGPRIDFKPVPSVSDQAERTKLYKSISEASKGNVDLLKDLVTKMFNKASMRDLSLDELNQLLLELS